MGRPDPRIRDAMLAHLRAQHPAMCRHWFDDIEPIELANGTLRLLVREAVQLRYLQRCCAPQFSEAAQVATGRLLAVQFIGEEEARAAARGARSAGAHASRARDALVHDDLPLSPDYCFENFMLGPGNQLAHAAAVAVAQKPGKAYNPLFLHGGVGLGKTHLLQAVCQEALRRDPDLRIHYVPCEDFKSQFHDAVQRMQMTEFRFRFRNVDLLVVDDIHDLCQKERTQEEFFHTFNALYQAGKQIVLSSDAAPSEIPELEERLVSRFNCGLVARIDKPCFETRVAIVKSKAALRGLEVPDDAACYIAARIDSNVREIEGAINSIQQASLLAHRPVDLDICKQVLGERVSAAGAAGPSIQTILDAIADFYDVRLGELLSKRRNKSVTRPRQIGMWLARKHTRYSLQEIGSYFGGRDHTTVLHAIKTVDDRRERDASIEREVARLEAQLTQHRRELLPQGSASSAPGAASSLPSHEGLLSSR